MQGFAVVEELGDWTVRRWFGFEEDLVAGRVDGAMVGVDNL